MSISISISIPISISISISISIYTYPKPYTAEFQILVTPKPYAERPIGGRKQRALGIQDFRVRPEANFATLLRT